MSILPTILGQPIKGGVNAGESQVKERPAPPAPRQYKGDGISTCRLCGHPMNNGNNVGGYHNRCEPPL